MAHSLQALVGMDRLSLLKWWIGKRDINRSVGDHSVPPSLLPPLRQLSWSHLEATVNQDSSIDINNITNSAREHLDFNDRIVKVSLGWGHLIVTTPTQCFIYK